MAASLDDPPDGLVNAAAVCFRNRTLLNVPDVRRNPLIKIGPKMSLPRSAMFVPVAARSEGSEPEILGILEIHNSRSVGYFPPEEQAAAQHLANQVAASLKLQEQHTIREQLFRTEKLAATGQLISGVASELRTPIESMMQLARSLAAYSGRAIPGEDLERLAVEAQRASEIVARLVSFSGKEAATPKQVDIAALLTSLVRFREPAWRTLGLRAQNRFSSEPVLVTASQGLIEQVLLSLLVHAEQRAAGSETKTIAVESAALGGRAVVEIRYATPAPAEGEAEPNPLAEALASGGAAGLGACQGIVHSHGGEIRFFSRSGAARFEVDLPAAAEAVEEPAHVSSQPTRALTLLLVDTDAVTQRQLLLMAGSRGHRVIPVSPEEASELVQRLRFDAVLWSVHSGGVRWSDFRERAGPAVLSFILVSDGYDRELARSLAESGGFLLPRPLDEGKLDRILDEIGSRTGQ
jgi:signal transduction histidine kinase